MFSKKHSSLKPYDKTKKHPVIRASICTGEQVAGFRNLVDGAFEDIMLIRDQNDLEEFCREYAVEPKDIVKEY